jgi:hypothetical protein
MSAAFTRYLLELAHDPDRAARFLAQPQVEAEAAGLSADETEALLSGDPARIRAALEDSAVRKDFVTVIR